MPRPPTTSARREIGNEVMRELERRVVLSVLDRKWREHLYEMDYLREGIGLRAYSQRDPLVEYQREGFDMFTVMMDAIKEESVAYLFNLEVQVEEEPAAEEVEGLSHLFDAKGAAPAISAPGLDQPKRPTGADLHGPLGDGGDRGVGGAGAGPTSEFAGVGRNDLCPCGSGKKYKRCHGNPDGPTGQTARVS